MKKCDCEIMNAARHDAIAMSAAQSRSCVAAKAVNASFNKFTARHLVVTCCSGSVTITVRLQLQAGSTLSPC